MAELARLLSMEEFCHRTSQGLKQAGWEQSGSAPNGWCRVVTLCDKLLASHEGFVPLAAIAILLQ